MPGQIQVRDDEPSPITQAAQIWAEGPEIVPFATDYVPPSSFGSVSVSGGNGSGAGTTASSSQVPDQYDLEWVAEDTADFDFYFDGVCWTPAAPADTLGLTWVETNWRAQVRSQQPYYYGYWWPPMVPWGVFLMEFEVTTEFMPDFNGLGPGTMVSLAGSSMWPGTYVWDLQTVQTLQPASKLSTRTWLSGKATINSQVTSGQIYPPSHWPVYTYA